MKKLEIGDTLPSFELKDQENILFSIDSLLGKKNLVIYFYPKDDSPGCTKQACSFRDQFEVFADMNAEIIGISAQSVESHRKFAEKYHLSYKLLSDTDNQVRKLFGIPSNFFGLLPGRVTYLISKEGKIIFIFNSQINAEKHVKEALRILEQNDD
jgi:peroxiredoxin Q/BCP